MSAAVRNLLGVLAAALVAAGCGTSGFDKAGGRHVRPVVLTVASFNALPDEAKAFADEVAGRSNGSIRIRFIDDWGKGRTDFETAVIRDVGAGRADIGLVGTRAWDARGVTSFDALQAPLLIDGYALEQRVFESGIPRRMLSGVDALGLVGLGVLPGPLRRPLAAPGPLRTAADFAGLRVGFQGAAEPAEALRVLGAAPVRLTAGAPWRGIDAIEQQVASIERNGYDAAARHLTANVALWPRPTVLFMSRARFAALTSRQQTVLRNAGERAVPAALAIVRADEKKGMVALCRRGIDLGSASRADLAGLRRAVAPELARLSRTPGTRASIAAISALRPRVHLDPPLACPGRGRPPAAGLPDGQYTVAITRDDFRRSRLPAREADPVGSRFTLVFTGGNFTLYQDWPDGRREVGFAGSYSLYRGRFVGTGTNGDVLRARWSLSHGALRFSDVEPRNSPYSLVWGSKSWTRRTG